MRAADGRLVPAGEFLPAADAADLMHEIDVRVLELAVTVLHQRADAGRPVRLFISQSARTLAREGPADHALGILAAYRVADGQVVIDVGQAEAVIHARAPREFCDAMAPAGARL